MTAIVSEVNTTNIAETLAHALYGKPYHELQACLASVMDLERQTPMLNVPGKDAWSLRITLWPNYRPPQYTFVWRYHGILHQEHDRPACITFNAKGSPVEMVWMCMGQRHRGHDRPAFVTTSELQWYTHGVLHRAGGRPAEHIRMIVPFMVPCTMVRFLRWYHAGAKHRAVDEGPAWTTVPAIRELGWSGEDVRVEVLSRNHSYASEYWIHGRFQYSVSWAVSPSTPAHVWLDDDVYFLAA